MSATLTLNLPIPTELAGTVATLISEEAYAVARRAADLSEGSDIGQDVIDQMVEKSEAFGHLANDLRRLRREAV